MTYKESIIHRLPQLIANKERKKEASVQNVFETLLNTEKVLRCAQHNENHMRPKLKVFHYDIFC